MVGAGAAVPGQWLAVREDRAGFEQRDRDVRAAVDQMAQQAETERAGAALHPACRRALER